MLQRVQTVLTVVLLVAVIFMAIEFYRGQRANEAAMTRMMDSINSGQQTSEAAAARLRESLDQLAKQSPAPPTVLQTVPRSGDANVDPSLTEIRITYNKPMMDGSWSWVYEPGLFETTGEPRYETDGRTCVLPVKLEPDKTYTIRLNSEDYHNFKDATGHPAVPYVLQFNTRK